MANIYRCLQSPETFRNSETHKLTQTYIKFVCICGHYSVNRKSCSRIYFLSEMTWHSGRWWLLKIIIQNRTHNCTNVPHSIFFFLFFFWLYTESKTICICWPGILVDEKRWWGGVEKKKIGWHSSYVCDCFLTHSFSHRFEFNMHGNSKCYGDERNEMWKINTFQTFQTGSMREEKLKINTASNDSFFSFSLSIRYLSPVHVCNVSFCEILSL